MKKRVFIGVGSAFLVLVLLYCFLTYTHTGRIAGLYMFAAFKAPISVKMDCIKDTNQRVYDKFLLPLDFTQDAKNGLREYWHFSYYRHCLFEAGYDFYGNEIESPSLTFADGVTIYSNPFGQVRMSFPGEMVLVEDNVTNPDLNDFLIASVLRVGEVDVQVNIDRSYKLADTKTLKEEFAGFEGQAISPSPYVEWVSDNVNGVQFFADEPYYGAVILLPEKHIVTIYTGLEDKDLIDLIAGATEVVER